MKIDPVIEPLVRATLDAAVKSEAKRFEQALGAFRSPEMLAEALNLTTAIVLAILHQQYEGGPNESELEQVAEEVSANEGWASLRHAEYLGTLTSMVSGQRDEAIEPQAMAVAAFVIAAYLLAAGTQKPKWWFEYLDEVEAVLERQ